MTSGRPTRDLPRGRRLHADAVDVNHALVAALMEQFPQWAELDLQRVDSAGTVNEIYQLGDELCVRLPLQPSGDADLQREWTWLPRLAPHLSAHIPEPVALGVPVAGYPFSWAVYRWIKGDPYEPSLVAGETDVAAALAQFVAELRAIDTSAAPPSGRFPIAVVDQATRNAIDAVASRFDQKALSDAWERGLLAPPWDGVPVWHHCDLLPPNLLLRDGRLHAILDFGGVGVGDPALDVIPAWSVFSPLGRTAFREALEVDDQTWERARAYALHQALMIIPYYEETNPRFVETAVRTVRAVLDDLAT